MEQLKTVVYTCHSMYCRKYERNRAVITDFKRNEDSLKASLDEVRAKLAKSEDRYEMLKAHAESKLQE